MTPEKYWEDNHSKIVNGQFMSSIRFFAFAKQYEKQYTKQDMLDFIKWFDNKSETDRQKTCEAELNEWEKQKPIPFINRTDTREDTGTRVEEKL